jgi:enamine deaminase RidA (YjgF/YER057c/UK114 family)
MERKNINPDTLMAPRGFTQVVAVSGASKLVYLAGQVAVDKDGKLVGAGDLAAQAKQTAANVKAALTAAGATPADVVKTNIYVVNYKASDYAAIREARAELFGTAAPPASTMVGVAALAVDGLLIEIEVIAALA